MKKKVRRWKRKATGMSWMRLNMRTSRSSPRPPKGCTACTYKRKTEKMRKEIEK